MKKRSDTTNTPSQPNLFGLLGAYKWLLFFLIALAFLANGLTLIIPKMISSGIDRYVTGTFVLRRTSIEFLLVAIGIFIFTALQSVVQVYVSERVARDMRTRLAHKISEQSYLFVEQSNPSKLLTNLTSDIDSVKNFVGQAIVSIFSSIILIVGVSVLVISTNWRLGLAVLVVVPLIGMTFFLVLRKVRVLFTKSREVIDWLNRVINESILGAALIRVLDSHTIERQKFTNANTEAKDLGMKILSLFAGMIPIITFVASLGTLTILMLGGHFVLSGTLTIGQFTSFISYLAILIFPIFVIGFMSNIIAQARASYQRISVILNAPDIHTVGTRTETLRGDIAFKNVSVRYGEKYALKHITLSLAAGTKTAIIGPTAAGKTQLLYLLTGLIVPTEGTITYDGHAISEYDTEALHQQIGFVFQDSILFNMSVRENIAFSKKVGDVVSDERLQKAIETAELSDFIENLPEKLDTIVSERGSSLSGGQKQRIMLARALALNPKVLLLDDFTARVDTATEKKILANVEKNYPDLTLVSVTQKIASVEHYDMIALLMEGELLAQGTHAELMATSPEYVQIYNSQESTTNYELQT